MPHLFIQCPLQDKLGISFSSLLELWSFSFFFSPFSEFSVVPFGTMVGFPSRRGNILSSCILVAVLWFWLERGVCQNGSSPFKSLVVKPIVIYYPWLSSRRNLPSFPQIFGVSDLCPWAVSPFPFALFF